MVPDRLDSAPDLDAVVELHEPEGAYSCPALKGIELVLNRGEAVAVSGPPGVGKTLLLRLIAGLEPMLGGSRECRAERMAYVFQNGGLVSNLTVRENISLPLTYHRYSDHDAQARTDRVIEEFRLEMLQHERPTELSAEQRRMGQLARAAALNADLLLLDELFLRLSPGSVALADRRIQAMREELGTAVIMTSLLESSVRPRADRWIELVAPDPAHESDRGV